MKIPPILQFTAYAIFAGIFTHPIWAWSFKNTFIPKPSDFFFALAIAGSIIYFLGEGRVKLYRIPRLLYLAFFLFGVGIVLAMMAGYIRYQIPFGSWHLILYHLFRIGGGFILALFVYIHLSENIQLGRWLSYAFLVSAIPFIPFLLLPGLAEKFSMVEQGRFLGLAGNTGMFAVLIFPAFVFALFFFLRFFFIKEVKKIWLFGFLWLAVVALILWSGARSYFGAMVLTSFISVLTAGYFYKASFKKILTALILIISILFVGLLFSPTLDKFKTISQPSNIFQELAGQAELIEGQLELQIKGDKVEIPKIQFSGEGRLAGAKYYLSLLRADPLSFILGLGINYSQRFDLAILIGKSALSVGRSIIFDVFLYGGMLAFAGIAILIWLIWQRMRDLFEMKAEPEQEPIYILASAVTLLGWWLAAIFLGTPVTLIPNWILLGIILSPMTNHHE